MARLAGNHGSCEVSHMVWWTQLPWFQAGARHRGNRALRIKIEGFPFSYFILVIFIQPISKSLNLSWSSSLFLFFLNLTITYHHICLLTCLLLELSQGALTSCVTTVCMFEDKDIKCIRISKGSNHRKILLALSTCKPKINVNLPKSLTFAILSRIDGEIKQVV